MNVVVLLVVSAVYGALSESFDTFRVCDQASVEPYVTPFDTTKTAEVSILLFRARGYDCTLQGTSIIESKHIPFELFYRKQSIDTLHLVSPCTTPQIPPSRDYH